MARYETDDGEPRYGKRLSPEELAAYLYEQGNEPLMESAADSDWSSDSQTPSYGSPVEDIGDGRDPGRGGGPTGDHGREDPDPYVRPSGGRAVRLAAPLPPVREHTGPGHDTGLGARSRAAAYHPWRMAAIGLVLMLVLPLILSLAAVSLAFGGSRGPGEPLGEAGTVYLEQGSASALYTSTLGRTTTDCTVTGPDGGSVALTPLTEDFPYGSFEAPSTGTFTVTCPGGTDDVIIGPPLDLSRLPLSEMLLLVAAVTGMAGLVVTIVGAVRLLRHRALNRMYASWGPLR